MCMHACMAAPTCNAQLLQGQSVCVCTLQSTAHICRVGQNHTFIDMFSVYTIFLAGKSPYIRSYTVCIYGSGQPYTFGISNFIISITSSPCQYYRLMW